MIDTSTSTWHAEIHVITCDSWGNLDLLCTFAQTKNSSPGIQAPLDNQAWDAHVLPICQWHSWGFWHFILFTFEKDWNLFVPTILEMYSKISKMVDLNKFQSFSIFKSYKKTTNKQTDKQTNKNPLLIFAQISQNFQALQGFTMLHLTFIRFY